MLIPSTFSQPGQTLFFSEPDITVYSDAIYMCGLNYFDGRHGIFTREGYLIAHAAFFHQQPAAVKGQPLWVDPNQAKWYPTVDRAIYVGHTHPQYGHFITEFIARLWAISRIRTDEKLLVRSIEDLEFICAHPWAAELFGLLGLTLDDFLLPRHPMVIKRLTVPTSSFAEDGYCADVFAALCNTLGDRAAPTSELGQTMRERNIYLSRSKLICGTISLANEEALEAELIARGFDIIWPEKLKVVDQICLFRNGNIPVGILGSAFHTSIFTPQPKGVAINLKGSPSLNYLLMDGVNEAEIEYYDPASLVMAEHQRGEFYETKVIGDPAATATHLAEIVEAKRQRFHVPNMGQAPVCDVPRFRFFSLRSHDGGLFKIDTRVGGIRTAEDRFFVELMLLSTGDDPLADVCYLLAARDDALAFQFEGTQLHGPLIPVRVVARGGGLGLRVLENGRYACCAPRSEGGVVTASAADVLSREYVGLSGVPGMPASGTRRARLLAIFALVFGFAQAGNMAFYLAREPALVAYAHMLRARVAAWDKAAAG